MQKYLIAALLHVIGDGFSLTLLVQELTALLNHTRLLTPARSHAHAVGMEQQYLASSAYQTGCHYSQARWHALLLTQLSSPSQVNSALGWQG